MQLLRQHIPQIALVAALTAVGASIAAWLVPLETRAVAEQFIGFPDSDKATHSIRPLVLLLLCFMPALGALTYAMGDRLDRYITRQFLGICIICFSALFLIWLLIDLGDNIGEFRQAGSILATLATYYGHRLPAVVLLLLPYAILLSVLYSLGKLSTNREIIAIIQSGRGVLRMTLPLLVAGLLFSLFCAGLNYHWAPVAEGRNNEILDEAAGKEVTKASQVLYHHPSGNRLWMIGAFPVDYQKGEALRNVEITTTDGHYRVLSRLSASEASWDRETRLWHFTNPVLGRFEPGTPPLFERDLETLVMEGWPETPWQLIKPGLNAGELGIPDLTTWLRTNAARSVSINPTPYFTQWHYRWALPFASLVTVLLAAPLAIHFSRRGPGGGMILAVVLSALMMVTSSIVLAFGEAGILRPMLAAWLPNITFGGLAIYLFHRRITGRPIYHTLRKVFAGTD